MPKSSKKKKEKAADFSKAKLKLGKGKQQANNVIDTSFKARSIALPSQSIAHESLEAPTTRRRLTFEDLISHLKHYNASTRKDTIFGLRELMEEHPELLADNLTALVNSSVRIIGDEDASVRKALLGFYTWLLPRIPQTDLQPHSPILLLFTTSALTHIFPEIRIDAIRFLDVFLEFIPEVVIQGWAQGSGSHGRRVLDGYLGVLSAGTAYGQDGDTGTVKATSTASVILSPGSKLVVLKSLATFLNRALSDKKKVQTGSTASSSTETPSWFLKSSFTSPSAFETFESLIRPVLADPSGRSSVRQWEPEMDPEEEDFVGDFPLAMPQSQNPWTLQELANIDWSAISKNPDEGQSSTGVNAEYTYAMHLAKTLQPILVSTFLDCAPAVFSPSSNPPETELNLVLAISDIARTLYGALLQDPSHAANTVTEDLSIFLLHMSPYFPFTLGGSFFGKRDIKAEQAFQDLNITYCELTSLLLLVSPTAANYVPTNLPRTSNGKRPAKTTSPGRLASLQVDRVHDYVVRLLRGEPPSEHATQALPRPIAASTYSALLPTVWALINHAAAERSQGVARPSLLIAVIEHAIKVSSTSAVKRHTLDFLGRIVLLNTTPEYRGPIRIEWGSEEGQKMGEWLLHLPKTVWELGNNNLASTEVIFRLLLRLHQRRCSLLHNEQTLSAIRSRLVPYFVIQHATRGKLPGPYAKLPPTSPLRRLALDVAASLWSSVDGDARALIAVVHEALDAGEEGYWVSIMRS